MAIWKQPLTLADVNQISEATLISHLGIEFVEIGEDFIKAVMPVDHRTIQPYGLLHGGASVTLAETLGSFASVLSVDEGKQCVGLEINANHVRAVRDGRVVGTVRPVHVGRSTHVWEIRIETEAGKLVSVARLTMAVLAGS